MHSLSGMTGELSEEALAQISGAPAAAVPASTSSNRLASTRSSTLPGLSTGTTPASGVGANAQATGVKKNVTEETGNAMYGFKNTVSVSLAAFMGTAAYLAL